MAPRWGVEGDGTSRKAARMVDRLLRMWIMQRENSWHGVKMCRSADNVDVLTIGSVDHEES